MRSYTEIHELRLQKTLSLVNQLKPQTILEIGCYPPEALLLPLRSQGYNVSGISSTFEPVSLPGVSSLNIETDPFPYPKNHFDLVLLCEVIEHMTDYPPTSLLQKIFSVLKPGGHLLVTTPNSTQLKNIARTLLPLRAPAGDDNIYSAHHHEYTLYELIKVLQSSNFTIKKASQIDFYTPTRSTSHLENPLIRLAKILAFCITSILPPTRDSLLVIVQKQPSRGGQN